MDVKAYRKQLIDQFTQFYKQLTSSAMSNLYQGHVTMNAGVIDTPVGGDLEKMHKVLASELVPGVEHEDGILLLRTLTPPLVMSSCSMVAEDVNGFPVRLSLYNYIHGGMKEAHRLLPKGCVLAIKHPYLKHSMDGGTSVRVDNPQNVVFLHPSNPYLTGTPFHDGSDSVAYKNVVASRKSGNTDFAASDYFGALEHYEKAIDVAETTIKRGRGHDQLHEALVLSASNAAEAALRVGLPHAALELAELALRVQPEHTKSQLRRVRAMIQVGNYDEARALVAELTGSIARESKAIKDTLKDCSAKIKEYEGQATRADFDWDKLLAVALDKEYEADLFVADYCHPAVRIDKLPGDAQQLVAAESIAQGTLLKVEKPLHLSVVKEEDRWKRGVGIQVEGHETPAATALHKALLRKSQLRFAGAVRDQLAELPQSSAGQADTHVRKVIDRCSRDWYHQGTNSSRFGEHTAAGVWPLGGVMRGSHAPNCTVGSLGPWLIIRADQDILEGDQLTGPVCSGRAVGRAVGGECEPRGSCVVCVSFEALRRTPTTLASTRSWLVKEGVRPDLVERVKKNPAEAEKVVNDILATVEATREDPTRVALITWAQQSLRNMLGAVPYDGSQRLAVAKGFYKLLGLIPLGSRQEVVRALSEIIEAYSRQVSIAFEAGDSMAAKAAAQFAQEYMDLVAGECERLPTPSVVHAPVVKHLESVCARNWLLTDGL